ncbi:MAG: hypothetical protein CME19_25875 [Gemmatimonadetes bacterium]|nr:hypothetical protein [Gemmatimonadota bacterium]
MSEDPRYIRLWPDGLPDDLVHHKAPEGTVNRDIDQNETDLNQAISNVADPGIYVYPCAPDTATGDVILICPAEGLRTSWWTTRVTTSPSGSTASVYPGSSSNTSRGRRA